MLGFPEALQQNSPRVLAAMPKPRVQNPADEGVRGRRLDSLGSAGDQRPVLTLVQFGPRHTQPKKLQQGTLWGPLCVCEYVYT